MSREVEKLEEVLILPLTNTDKKHEFEAKSPCVSVWPVVILKSDIRPFRTSLTWRLL
jgi:hypothetical protein